MAIRDAVRDVQAAVRFIVNDTTKFGIDPQRIVAWGESAGAIIAASMNLVDSKDVEAGLPSNITAAVGLSGCIWPFLLTDTENHKWRYTPWFDVHGSHDTIVFGFLASVTYTFLESLGASPASNRLAWVPGAGHVPWSEDVRRVLRPQIQAFLMKALKLEDDAMDCPSNKSGKGIYLL